jgi:hypothetical protein
VGPKDEIYDIQVLYSSFLSEILRRLLILAGVISGQSYSSGKGLDEVASGELLRIRAGSNFLEEINGIVVARVSTTHFIEHTTPGVGLASNSSSGRKYLSLGIVRLEKTGSRGTVRRLELAPLRDCSLVSVWRVDAVVLDQSVIYSLLKMLPRSAEL